MRKEKDSMGEVLVPKDAYFGAQTQRAADNFPISNRRIPSTLIKSLGMIKRSAAIVNHKLNRLEPSLKDAIVKASDEVISGKFNSEFIVDIYQTGSGTSSNMNVIVNVKIIVTGKNFHLKLQMPIKLSAQVT